MTMVGVKGDGFPMEWLKTVDTGVVDEHVLVYLRPV